MNKTHTGKVVQIIGSVVDVKFDNHLPNQNELLLVLDGDWRIYPTVSAAVSPSKRQTDFPAVWK